MGNISADIRKYVANLKAERDAAKAEIARLTDYNARLHADIAEIGKDNDELEAEIARLREATLEEAAKFIEANTIMDGGTGQSIVPRKYDGDRFGLAYADGIRALKPDTEGPDLDLDNAQYQRAKAEDELSDAKAEIARLRKDHLATLDAVRSWLSTDAEAYPDEIAFIEGKRAALKSDTGE